MFHFHLNSFNKKENSNLSRNEKFKARQVSQKKFRSLREKKIVKTLDVFGEFFYNLITLFS